MSRSAILLLAAATALASVCCRFDPSGLSSYDVGLRSTDAPAPGDGRTDGTGDALAPLDGDAPRPADGQPDAGSVPWRDKAWSRRKRITVLPAKVTATLKSFPLLVALAADKQLAASARKDGGDLHFTAADGKTRLKHEIEHYEEKSGALVAWVKVPALSATAPTVLFLYYGNPGASGMQDAAAVFDSGYEAVWHLHGDPSSAVADATGKHPGASRGGMKGGHLVAAKIGRGYKLDGNDDAVDVGAVEIAPDGPGDDGLTMEAWVRADKADGRIISKANEVAVQSHWWMCALADGSASSSGYNFRLKTAGSTTWQETGGAPPLATWMHLAFTYDGAAMRIYKDGAQLASTPKSGTVDTSSSVKVSIGDNPVGDRFFQGILDEVRLSRVARSAAWLATQHNNQSAPSSFYTLGAEEKAP